MLRDQFLMRDSTMLKIFLTGAASSTAVRAAFAARDDARARTAGSEYVGAQTGVPATLAGSFMVGVGMAVAGGCPSLAYAQVGAGMERALISLTGLAAGVLAYSLTAERFAPWVAWKRLSPRFSTMSTILAVRPWVAGAAVAAAFLGVAFVLEWVSPTVDGWGWGPRDARWHPIFCGLFVGLPQMPLTMALSKNIGASSSLLTLMAAASYPWSRGHPVMSAKLHGMRNWWQVIYVAGIFLAPLLWRLVVDAPRQGVYDWGVVVEGLVGGVVGGFGARLAGGCTSAHGISGNGHLASISMLATVGIFLGGIAAAFALYA